MSPLLSWRRTFKTVCLRVFVCFLLEAANSCRKQSPTSADCLLQSRLITLTVLSDNPAGHRELTEGTVGIPVLPYRATAPFLIKVIRCRACRGKQTPDRPNPQASDNIGPYHPCSSRGHQCLTVILYNATQSPEHWWESVFLSSRRDKYPSSTSTTP